MNKATNAEMEKRVHEVYRMLLVGADRLKIIQYCAEKWKVGERTADLLIHRATEILDEKVEVNAEKLLNKSLKTRWDLLFRAIQAKEIATAHEIAKDLDKLLGLYPTKVELSIEMKFVSEFVDKVTLALNKTIPEKCPHCRNGLEVKQSTIRELEVLSQLAGG